MGNWFNSFEFRLRLVVFMVPHASKNWQEISIEVRLVLVIIGMNILLWGKSRMIDEAKMKQAQVAMQWQDEEHCNGVSCQSNHRQFDNK
ncbi:hypothetical protein Ddye_012255 [Dipteronia dyeriana]|uniref:Uncharacterized protein n=1 Tax=Dipteronia dyeriana TaxID=168575 RepID=A0AAD9X415_9ROSI|nr:hypothetical protein Ddye_012255 [Dipteronia dyeriana]